MVRKLTLMKRALLLLMMLILPVQSVWAGADVDCQASYLVACEHGATSTPMNEQNPTQPSTHLDDCCACHLGHADGVAMSLTVTAEGDIRPAGTRGNSPLASHITPPPERPQWA
jgi:hypothetical protein